MANLNTANTADGLDHAIKTQYEKRLLTRAIPRMVHTRWAKKANINKFGSYELRKYGSLSAISTTLTEGTTPAENAASTLTLVTMTPDWYGAYIGYTDLLDMTAFDPIVSEMSGILGEQAGLTADTICRTELIADATIDYPGAVAALASLDSPQHDIGYADIIKQLAYLEAESALPADGEDFIIITHPHTWATLMQDPVFVNMFIQESPSSALRSGYVGRILRSKVFVSANAYEIADAGVGSTTDVYGTLFIGRESYGMLGISNTLPDETDSQGPDGGPLTGKGIKPVEIIMKGLGSAGANDPLNQRGTLAWKMSMDVEVLNSAWIRCLKHTNAFSDD